ncbi:hypothetical protein BHM03_00057516 [Ensete ventricosum]|nr:hypothetical protein BHM03_00057516 [Ensete ventricosum]
MAAAKHIATRCRADNVTFIECKKKDPNPEKCLNKGRHVTCCVLNFIHFLQTEGAPPEMDAYAGCMYYYTNDFDLCRKEQEAFEKACPVSE